MHQLLRKVIDNKYVTYFQVMSNGLFRDHYYDLISCVKFRLYCEHLIQDIIDGDIQYNTQLPFVTDIEVWTFLSKDGGKNWKLSAIEQYPQ
jgi:hypothetical protein